jgi:Co/Zn/Cd efflux system component
LLEHERIALSMIALITGMMGFIESMIAVPAASTAMAADALSFVQHSVSAGFALRAATGFTRRRWTVLLQGAVMMVLGALVCLIAARRFVEGSVPHPILMLVMGFIALSANFSACTILLLSRRQLTGIKAVWRISRADAVGSISVIAAAVIVLVLRQQGATFSNIPDVVIGGAMAALFMAAGWRILYTGRADANQVR